MNWWIRSTKNLVWLWIILNTYLDSAVTEFVSITAGTEKYKSTIEVKIWQNSIVSKN